jgi:hypothetical protein
MNDFDEQTTVIDTSAPTPVPKKRRQPGWPLVAALAVLFLAASAAAIVAFSQRSDARDDLKDAKAQLEASDDAARSDVSSLEDDNEELTDDLAEQKALVASLRKQLKRARADLAKAKKDAAAASSGTVSASDESAALDAARAEVTSMVSASAAGCANYTFIGASDDGSHVVTRADWNSSGCASKYETLEFLFQRSSSGGWSRVPIVAHPVGEPDIDTGAICNQVITASDAVRAEISQACH